MDLCTLRFHYGGYFASEGDTLMYEGGLVDDLRVDPDRLSWIIDSDASVNLMVTEMMLEAPPANDGENGQQGENGEEAENAHNNDGNDGDVGNEDNVGDVGIVWTLEI
ncbi:hypothetical protein COLO4_07373 [Corchorus olitorius]|uniref:PB1-like domain-containing protein n=1 Tax=Corchorus olitorius TaxID=93759 RepID=A0A1R3KJZ4_9ROSI|nr:hypothetical protein COLO4_07373 [Corchorus olitorius]